VSSSTSKHHHILILLWNLGSPVLVDIDNDGHVEVLVAVSYYFDKDEYAGRDLDFDPSLYVAGGLACWDLEVSGECVIVFWVYSILSAMC
jgi:hypothetical protein